MFGLSSVLSTFAAGTVFFIIDEKGTVTIEQDATLQVIWRRRR